MASTSRYAFVLDSLRSYLDDESTFDVRKVFTKETFTSNTKTLIYANIISDDLAQFSAESRLNYGARTIKVGIYAVATKALDTADAGTGAILHGQIVEKIDARIDAWANTLPTGDTTTAGYTVTIHSIQTAGVTGHVDDKSPTVALLYELDVHYTMGTVA